LGANEGYALMYVRTARQQAEDHWQLGALKMIAPRQSVANFGRQFDAQAARADSDRRAAILAARPKTERTLKREAYERRLKQLEASGMSGPMAIAQARAEGLYVSAF
jgi:hypothetical protein